jgi:hypothetical protein
MRKTEVEWGGRRRRTRKLNATPRKTKMGWDILCEEGYDVGDGMGSRTVSERTFLHFLVLERKRQLANN